MNVLSLLLGKLKQIAIDSNQKGVPIPLLRDNGKGSYTLTMFWIAFNMAILTLMGKVTKFLGDVNYNDVLWLLGLTGSLYLGKHFSGSGNQISVDNATFTAPPQPPAPPATPADGSPQ